MDQIKPEAKEAERWSREAHLSALSLRDETERPQPSKDVLRTQALAVKRFAGQAKESAEKVLKELAD